MSKFRSEASLGDRAFALLQELLPQHFLSKNMHRLARSSRPGIRKAMIRSSLRAYPEINMAEALEPDPYAYSSFNDFFTRALRPGSRTVDSDAAVVASPVDGTLSQAGTVDRGQVIQAKGIGYSTSALLADIDSPGRYMDGHFSCLYLAPYNYHRIHMPLDARLIATRYVPGKLFSVSAATARAIPGLFTRNERVICEFETALGHLAMVLVGAMFVGSIETVYAGEINPPSDREPGIRRLPEGIGTSFERGDELGRFNMGSTVIMLLGNRSVHLTPGMAPGTAVRLGQPLARCS